MRAEMAEAMFRRDRAIVSAGLGGVILLAWAYTYYLAQDMTGATHVHAGLLPMDAGMPALRPWGLVDIGFIFLMWVVMQVAMMIPSASPMIIGFAKLSRQRFGEQSPLFATTLFFLGYVVMWTAFSVGATLAQWGLHSAALLSPTMVSTSSVLGGLILIAAGIFQFTQIKEAAGGIRTSCDKALAWAVITARTIREKEELTDVDSTKNRRGETNWAH